MNNKILICICTVIVVMVFIIIVMKKDKKEINKAENSVNVEHKINLQANEDESEFTIVDEGTGETLFKTNDKATALEWEYFYKKNPDYRTRKTIIDADLSGES